MYHEKAPPFRHTVFLSFASPVIFTLKSDLEREIRTSWALLDVNFSNFNSFGDLFLPVCFFKKRKIVVGVTKMENRSTK